MVGSSSLKSINKGCKSLFKIHIHTKFVVLIFLPSVIEQTHILFVGVTANALQAIRWVVLS